MRYRKLRPGWLILAAALLFIAAKAFILDAAVVDGRSMLPTLKPGSFVLVLRCAYGLPSLGGSGYLIRWAAPRRGDVVAAASPRDGLPVVKRVAAVGPQSLACAAGRLVGPGLDAPLSADQEKRLGAVVDLPSRSVFLLGDNPAESVDSRDYGAVAIQAVSGRVLVFGARKKS
jgi:signal peptidase I